MNPLQKILPAIAGLLVWHGTAAAGTYQVSGPDSLVGRAWVTHTGLPTTRGRPISVTLRYSFLKKKARKEKLLDRVGAGFERHDGTLVWSFVVRERRRHRFRFWKHKTVERTVEVVLRPAGWPRGAVLEGRIDGARSSWLPEPEGLVRNTKVFLVPGLGTNLWNRVGIPYLNENTRAFLRRGFAHVERMPIQTEASVRTNAAVIAEKIRKEAALGRRVILFAHSKGATDTTAALALNPDLREHVLGVIAVQPVFNGSPVADYMIRARLTGVIKVFFERVLRGEREAVTDLTHASRRAFVAAHPYPALEVPTVVIRSSFSRRFSRSLLWGNQKLISRRERQPNDGMVTLADSTIPGAVVTLDLENLDHFEPGVRNESRHTPGHVTNLGINALIYWLTQRKP